MRYSARRSSVAATACGVEEARSVWMWRCNPQDLTAPGALLQQEDRESLAPRARAFSRTNLLLIELDDGNPLFRERFARRAGGAHPPSTDALVDRLERALGEASTALLALAVVDGGHGISEAMLSRLGRFSPELQCFGNRGPAMRWLLTRQLPTSEIEPRLTRLAYVGLADVGGAVARTLLSRLHAETRSAAEATTRRVLVIPRKVRLGLRLWTQMSTQGVRSGDVRGLRPGPRNASGALPAWSGKIGWLRFTASEFTLETHRNGIRPGSTAYEADEAQVLVVGIGPSRRSGEQQLVKLLEGHWAGDVLPAALLVGNDADRRLRDWAVKSFPGAPQYPASLGGGLRALRTALRRSARGIAA